LAATSPIMQIKNFKPVNFGNLTGNKGSKQLKVVNNKFPQQNKSSRTKLKEERSGNLMCAQEKLKVEMNTSDFRDFITGGVPDWLKPGIMMDASSFLHESYKIIEGSPRFPIVLSTNLRGVENTYMEVDNPGQRHKITEAESKLISQNARPVPAQMTFTYHELKTAEEFAFKLTGQLTSTMLDFAAGIGLTAESEKESHFYLVEFHQTMFGIEVNGLESDKIFMEKAPAVDNLIYVSKVNYGRRGFIMFKSKKSLEQLGAEVKVSGGNVVNKASLNSSFNLLKTSSEVEIKAFYYGGSTESVSQSIRESIEDGKPGNIVSYIEGQSFDHTLGMPVSYEMKNLQNERVGLGSDFEKYIYTCVPWKSDILKLKVTLTDIQCVVTADGDKTADYGIRQHLYYKANNNVKEVVSKSANKHGGSCPLGNDVYWLDAISLMCGGSSKQLHVNEGNARMLNINNSVIFHITPEEYNDKNAEFILETWVKEYNGGSNDLVLNNDPPRVHVAIKDVLDILSGIKTLNANSSFKADAGIAKGVEFDYFDGTKLPLSKVNSEKTILEGVIRARNKGAKLTDKAAVWVRFELMD
ncbi:MAG: thiol-activated cytolysin family protein, partial [Ginsengibacter sp.]